MMAQKQTATADRKRVIVSKRMDPSTPTPPPMFAASCQQMQKIMFDTSLPLQTRRDAFERFMICTAGSQEAALDRIREFIGDRDVMEFCASDPRGELICCSWLLKLQNK